MSPINFSCHFPRLVDLLVKGVGVALVVLAAAWLLRRSSAAHRHLVWLCAVGVLAAIPFFTLESGVAVAPAGSKTVAGPIVIVRIPALEAGEPARVSAPAQLPEPAGTSMRSWCGHQGWRGLIVGVWGGGVLLAFAVRILTMVRLRGLRKHARTLGEDHALGHAADRFAREAGIRRRIDWRVSERAPVAMTWGWWRPVVLLPRAALVWPRERIELVLRHEVAHVARADSLVRALAGFACALHWPNPLSWLVARRLRLEQEQACDDAVLRAGVSAEAYAEELVAAARAWMGRAACGGAVAMAEPSSLERRILGILNAGRRGVAGRRAMLGAGLAACVLLVGCSLVGVRERSPAASAADVKERGTNPSEEGSATSSAAASAAQLQVQVGMRFVKLKGDRAKNFDAEVFLAGASAPGGASNASLLGHLSIEEAERRISDLASRFGINMSAPTAIVPSGKNATMTIAQEFRYPSSFNGPPTEHTTFKTQDIGVESSVLPTIQPDGRVAVEVETMVREFEGYISGPSPAESVQVPIFAERVNVASVVLRPGEVAVLRASGRKKVMPENAPEWARKQLTSTADEEAGQAQPILIFIDAKVLPTKPRG